MPETEPPAALPGPFANVPATLAATLASRGFTELTPVQSAVIAAEAGRDLLVSARTGSGKTVAFGLRVAPLLERRGKPGALVVCPTRELAMQVAKELEWLFSGGPGNPGLRVVACVGGMDPRRESMQLGAGVEIVVGTPGRLCDHINRKNLRLDGLAAVVLDEADEMLDMGFRDELEIILQACPKERQTLLFSATFPPVAVALAEEYTRSPIRLALADAKEPHADIQWVAMLHAPREREAVVVNVLRHYDSRAALVFCHTRETVHRMHAMLSERGFSAAVLSGDLGQAERSRALAAVRDGRARVLVATNVAARGIDLPTLDLVIHADLPHDVESFTHRSGRTGRAGRKGIAVVLVAASRRRAADRLFQNARVNPERLMPPRPDAIRVLDEGRLGVAVLAGLTGSGEEDLALAEKLLTQHSPAALVASLVASYRQQLPTPEDLPETFALGRREERPREFPPTRGFEPQGRQGERRDERPHDRFERGPVNDQPVFRPDPRDERGSQGRPQEDRGSQARPRDDRGPSRDDRGPGQSADDRGFQAGPREDRGFQARPRDDRGPAPRQDQGFQARPRDDRGPGPRDDRSPGPRQDQGFQARPRDDRGPGPRDDRGPGPRQDQGFHARPRDDRGPGPRDDRGPGPRQDQGFQARPRDDRGPGPRDAPRLVDTEGGMRPPTRPQPPAAGGQTSGPKTHGAATFKVNRGYKHNAEPFWLVPLFCRRGRVDKQVIGRIDIRERETWFEIDPTAAEAFAQSVAMPDQREPGVKFDRVE